MNKSIKILGIEQGRPGHSYEYSWPGMDSSFCGRMGAYSMDDVRQVIRKALNTKRLPDGFTVVRY